MHATNNTSISYLQRKYKLSYEEAKSMVNIKDEKKVRLQAFNRCTICPKCYTTHPQSEKYCRCCKIEQEDDFSHNYAKQANMMVEC